MADEDSVRRLPMHHDHMNPDGTEQEPAQVSLRPTWDETWMAVADTIALRSRCVRRRAGCVLVSVDNQLIAAGYNGPPGGFRVEYERIGAKRLLDANETCDTFCERAKTGGSLSYDDCVSVHSEVNALVFADHKCLIGGTAYVTSCPCFGCAKNLSNSGLIRVVYRITEADRDREPQRTAEFFATCGIAQTQLL